MYNKLEQFLKILIGASFFMPLIVVPTTFIFPFIVPKIVTFRSLVVVMAAIYLILLLARWKQYKIRPNVVHIAVSLFLLSFVISTFVGVDPYRSFWDNHERMLGLFTIIHFILYFLMVSALVRDWREWRWLFRVFTFAGSIVMLIGIFQKINPELLLNRNADRVVSTLGNAIYVSGYGMFLFFLSALLFTQERLKHWRIYAVVTGVLGLSGVFTGGTRGALLGLVAGIGVAIIGYFFTAKENKKIRHSLGGLILVGVVIFGLLFAFRQTSFVKSIPAIGRLVNTSLTAGTANTRILAWGTAIEGWKDKPIFGWGPNNYYFAFNKHYPAEIIQYGWAETWFDNAHNIIMNTLTVQGLVGVVTYLSIFIAAIYMLIKAYKKGTISQHEVNIGIAFLVAHLVQNVFVFENPTSYMYFFFFLAYIAARSAGKYKDSDTGGTRFVSTPVKGIILVVGLVVIYTTNIHAVQANTTTLTAIQLLYSNPNLALEAYREAESYNSPHIDDIRLDFSRTIGQLLPEYSRVGRQEDAKRLLDVAYEEVQKNYSLHPLDVRNHIQHVTLSQNAFRLSSDIQYLIDAEIALEVALEASPLRQQLLFSLSTLKVQLGKQDEAAALLRRSIDAYPPFAESWWRLALAYFDTGDPEKAREVIEEAKAQNILFNSPQSIEVLNIIMATSTPAVSSTP